MNRHGFALLVSITTLTTMAPAQAQDKKGVNYAFLVACKQYSQTEFPPLPHTIKEMTEFQKVLELSGFDPKNIKFLHDEQNETRQRPLKRAILKELDLLIERIKPTDMLVIAINGHGLHFKGDKVSYFQPIDAEFDDKSSMIPMEGEGGLIKRLERCRATQKLLLVNACRNDPGDFAQAARKVQLDEEDTDTKSSGIATIYSCNPGQRSYYYPPKKEYPKSPGLERSLFFHHVIESWSGNYSKTGQVTLDQVIGDIENRVAADADDILGVKQRPLVKRKYEGKWIVNDKANLSTRTAAVPAPLRLDMETEAKALNWVKERGGRIVRDPDRKDEPIVAIQGLSANQIRQADLQHLSAFPLLEKLEVSGFHLGEHQVKYLAALPALHTLTLKNPRCTEAGATELAKLTHLKQIDVEQSNPAIVDVTALSFLPRITSYQLLLNGGDYEPIIQAVARLNQITKLRIFTYPGAVSLSDKELAALAKMKKLTELEMNFTEKNQGLTIEGFKHLKSMTNIKTLGLGFDGYQPAAHIRMLAEFTHLNRLGLSVYNYAELCRVWAKNRYDGTSVAGENEDGSYKIDETKQKQRQLQFDADIADAAKRDISSEIEALKRAFPMDKGSIHYSYPFR